ncbi:MAG: hypothetical protein KF859_10745 [Phycisphaeraceae bacterium]|nr:hypothetical protein [Phycisphaeraceae bacterium]
MSGHEHTPVIHDHADEWHHHERAEGLPQREHTAAIDSGLIMRWMVGILIFVVGLIVIVSTYFAKYATQLRAERVETTIFARDATLAQKEAEAALGLGGSESSAYKWADSTAGQVQIPIRQAMQKVVESYSGK